MIAHIVAAIPLLIWLYLLLARGEFWRVARHFAPPRSSSQGPKRVVAVIPARNEAAVIGAAVTSLLRQSLDGSIHVIVIDDGSTDGTAAAAAAAGTSTGTAPNLTVIHGAPLPPEWTGKLWALSQGVAAAAELAPDYLLFTDADIHHDRDNVASLVANAEAYDRDLVSYMVKLSTASFADRCLIPAFVFFFLMLYPPAWIASPAAKTAGAAGGCMLIRPRALARIGGLAAIRAQIIDDCALARAVKGAGGRIWLGLTRTTTSLRGYGSLGQIGSMISRSAFNQLGHSFWLLAATILGLLLTYALPPLLLLTRDPVLIGLGATAWAIMTLCYVPMVRFYGVAALSSLGLPAIAVFYAGATIHSAVQYALGRGGKWKDRIQDLRA